MQVAPAQAVAFRLAAHGLAERRPAGEIAAAAAACGLPDYPPGSAVAGLAARVDGVGPEAATDPAVVIVPSVRMTARLVPLADAAVFTAGLLPPDEKTARSMLAQATRTLDEHGIGALDAMERVTAAVSDALAGGELGRDAFHQALRNRLEPELLPWCPGCRSHHVAPALWRSAALHGALAIVPRGARAATFARPPAFPDWPDPGAELARRFVRAYGPASPEELATWAGMSLGHAKRLWRRIGPELCDAPLPGRDTEILEADEDRLADPPPATGARLLAPRDAFLDQRDRETLLPDRALRDRVVRPAGGPGIVLAEGAVAGLWSARKTGDRVRIEVEALGAAAARAAEALGGEAERLAAARGAAGADLAFV